MTLREWNEKQIKAALGEVNRYYYWLHYGHDAPDENALILYFVEFGAKKWRENESSLENGSDKSQSQ